MQSSNKQHPGEIIRQRYLEPLGLNPSQFAKHLGLQEKEVTDLLKTQQDITAEWAIRLGLYFDVPPQWWLEMQNHYDLGRVEDLERLRQIIQPYEGLTEIIVTPGGTRHIPKHDQEAPTTISVAVSKKFVERLRAQAKLNEPRQERTVEEVRYENGTVALVGREK